MRQILNQLIQALRNEWLAYGEMSALLDQHHQSLAHPSGEGCSTIAAKVLMQGVAVQRACQHRRQSEQALIRVLRPSAAVPIEQLISLLPVNQQPLVIALVRASRERLAQVLQSLRRNGRLLASAVAWSRRYRKSALRIEAGKTNPAPAQMSVRIPLIDLGPTVGFEVEITKRPIASVPVPFL